MGEGQRLRAGAWRAQQARYCSTDDSLTAFLKSPGFQREWFSVNCDVGDATGGSSCVLRGQFLFQQLYGAEGCHGSRHRPHPHNANKPPLATTPSPTSAPVATPGDLFTGAASRLDQLHRVSISCMARALFSFSLHAGACCTDHQALPPAAKRDNRVEGSAKRRAVGAAPTHLAMVTVVEVSVGVDAMVAN